MRIDEMPRPWLLAAMTGVPMSVLLERAEQERAERAEQERAERAERERRNVVREQYRGSRLPVAERHLVHRPVRLAS
jgi:hypothetical protein